MDSVRSPARTGDQFSAQCQGGGIEKRDTKKEVEKKRLCDANCGKLRSLSIT